MMGDKKPGMSAVCGEIAKLDWHDWKLRVESFELNLWGRSWSIGGIAFTYEVDML